MKFEELKPFPTPQKVIVKDTEGDKRVPYERIKSYDDKEFELFIREWVVSLKDKYQVRGFGGAGDKGRDVIAQDLAGRYYYYQCKHYDHALTPSDALIEFAKLVYYTFTDKIPIPCEYYILAPYDVGPKLSDLIENPTKINAELAKNWVTKYQDNICSTSIPLSEELKHYIDAFDFSIIKTKSMLEVVSEHQTTAFYAFRFGGGLTVKRNRSISVPSTVASSEATYIQKILQAISEKENRATISWDEVAAIPHYVNSLTIQRERFYSAENLRVFTIRYLLTDEYFTDLSNDIYHGVFDYLERSFPDGYERMNTVLSEVAKIDLSQNLLVKYDLVHTQDRQGICHILANEREDFVWTNKK